MEITLSIEEEGSGRSEEVSVDAADDATVKDILEAADINPETVLVEHEGRIVPKDAPVEDGTEKFRVLQVISGG